MVIEGNRATFARFAGIHWVACSRVVLGILIIDRDID